MGNVKSMFTRSPWRAVLALLALAGLFSLAALFSTSPFLANAGHGGLIDGDIFHVSGDSKVYITKMVGAKHFKRWVQTPQIFSSYLHLNWANLKTVTQATSDAYTETSLVRALGDTMVYYVSGSTRQWVATPQALTANNWDWDSVYTINSFELALYQEGAPITGAITPTPTPSPTATPAPTPIPITGTNYYVASNGADTNPGTITQPFKTIAKANAVAQKGDGITIRAGTYRESIIIKQSNLTIQSYPGEIATIKGSDVVTSWTQEPGKNIWSASVRLSAPPNISSTTIGGYNVCASATPLCRFPYQIFVNGANLAKVAQGTDPGPGQFTWSDTSQNPTMRIGTDPTGKTVEVSVRNQWITGALVQGSNAFPNNVTIRGLTFRHSVGGYGPGGIETGPSTENTGTGWTIEQNDIGWAHTSGINLRNSSHTIQNNTIHHNAPTGIDGNALNTRITANTLHDNNNEGFWEYFHAGGVKITQSRFTTVSNNTVHDNTGPGIWCDIVCSDVTFANNRVYRNTIVGIFYEISTKGTIKDNIIFDNGTQGISISNSDNSTVTGNISVRNLFSGIWLEQGNRNTNQWTFPDTQNNVVQNNTAIGDGQNAAIQNVIGAFYRGGTNLLNTNTVDNNKVFRYGSIPTIYYWITKGYNTPAALCAAIGKECASVVLTQQQADQILQTNGIPASPPTPTLMYTSSSVDTPSFRSAPDKSATPMERDQRDFREKRDDRIRALEKRFDRDRANRIDDLFSRMAERFVTTLERLDEFAARIEMRINRAAEDGKEVELARQKLSQAKEKIARAKTFLDEAEDRYTEIIKARDLIRGFKKVRQIVKELEASLQAARQALLDTITTLKGLSIGIDERR